MFTTPLVRTCSRLLIAVAVISATASACSASAGSSSGAAGTTTPSSTSSTVAAPPVERFTGTEDAFYAIPQPLPTGPPGSLLRVKELGTKDGATSVKVMYLSRDAADRNRAATAIVTYPTAEAPPNGWPIQATAPGTVGIAAKCGVTRRLDKAPDWGVGGVRVITDYLGLGATGGPLHAYLSKKSEGHSVLDAVRAARNLPEAHAGKRWLSIGHSQGGHGALSAHELAASYAPELELVGTLALAPAAMLDRVYGGIDPIVTSVLTVLSLYGGAGEHPEIHVGDYVTPELAATASVLETGCLDEITNKIVPLVLANTLFTQDPRRVEPTKSLVAENEVGDTRVDAPLFVVQGTKDDRVVVERTRDLFARLCKTGQVTELLIIDGATHDTIIPQTATRTSAWLRDRLDGKPATNSCTTAATGTTG